MNRLFRRNYPRHDTSLSLQLGIAEWEKGERPNSLVPAVMINISRTGCCLVVTTPLVEGKHLFFKTLDSPHHLLFLLFSSLPGNSEASLLARPVWMDSCTWQDGQGYKIGMKFTEKLADLSPFLAA